MDLVGDGHGVHLKIVHGLGEHDASTAFCDCGAVPPPTPGPPPTPENPSEVKNASAVPAGTVLTVAEYTSDEILPSGVTASDLMNSIVYKAAKTTGLCLFPSPIIISIIIRIIADFIVDACQLSAVVGELSVAVSATTSFTVQVADASVAEVLSLTVQGTEDVIKEQEQINIAMAAADWSGDSVITGAPTMGEVVTMVVTTPTATTTTTVATVTTEDLSSPECDASKTTICDVVSIVMIAVLSWLV
ncbi:unnamed protein product [Prorocentrum cordatum]|uniref:Subtilisin n=1 Tax=Prorocentrum cordatum TaxID=2364126 RepID=A0ABN9TIM4_9DINO|nr:unnamed protein product [Polarella glacialis]